MTLRNPLPAIAGVVLGLGLFLASPSSAVAGEVMCASELGECTISNNGQSWISCSCDDESSTGGSGGDEFAGMTDGELLDTCHEYLSWCDLGGDGDGDGDVETGTDTGSSDDGEEGFETFGESGDDWTTGEEGFETFGESGDDWTTGEEGFETFGESGDDWTTSGDDGESGDPSNGDSGDELGEDEQGDGPAEGDGDAEGNGSTGDDGPGDGDGDPGEGDALGDEADGDGDGDGGDETGLALDEVELTSGCSVTTHSGLGLLGLALLGLFGIHRRERAQLQ